MQLLWPLHLSSVLKVRYIDCWGRMRWTISLPANVNLSGEANFPIDISNKEDNISRNLWELYGLWYDIISQHFPDHGRLNLSGSFLYFWQSDKFLIFFMEHLWKCSTRLWDCVLPLTWFCNQTYSTYMEISYCWNSEYKAFWKINIQYKWAILDS